MAKVEIEDPLLELLIAVFRYFFENDLVFHLSLALTFSTLIVAFKLGALKVLLKFGICVFVQSNVIGYRLGTCVWEYLGIFDAI